MTKSERLQGAALCFLFAVVCLFFARSAIQESRASGINRGQTQAVTSEVSGSTDHIAPTELSNEAHGS